MLKYLKYIKIYLNFQYISQIKFNKYTTQNLLRITFSTVCYFCVILINEKIDFKEFNIISASCT